MKRALAILAAIAWRLCNPVPAGAAEPCERGRVLVVRDGKAFTREVATAPGFDPRKAPALPLCDGDEVNSDDLLELTLDSMALEDAKKEASRVAEERANERAGAAVELQLCRSQEAIEHAGRVACERDKAPPPPVAPKWYQRASFWAGSAIAVAALVVGVAAKSDHPLLWAAGGVGVGIVIGGEL